MCGRRQVFKLHWRHFPKSAEVGGKHGTVQCKAAAGFVPVHRCRSPHIRLIQSHRHQMPWKCQTQFLKRQQATEEEAQTASSTTTEDIYTLGEKKKKSTSVSKCKWCCQDWKDGWDIKRSPLWVTCIRRTSMEFLCIQKYQTSFCMTAADFVWQKIRIPHDSFPILAVHHRKSYSLLHCSTLSNLWNTLLCFLAKH